MSTTRKPYPSDVPDAEWESLAPYLTLVREDAPQRESPPRGASDALRDAAKAGCPWDFLPHDFPPASAVYQRARGWMAAGVFGGVAHDLRVILRLVGEREAPPTAVVLDGRALRSTPESGGRAGYDGAKRRNGSTVPSGVDPPGHLLARKVTAAREPGRARVAELTARLPEVTGGAVGVAFAGQGYAGEATAAAAQRGGIRLEVVKHAGAERGFALPPRRWVVERSLAWLGRFRRLARGSERLAAALAGWHWLAFRTALPPRLGLESA